MARLCPVCGATYPATIAFCPSDGTTLRAVDAGGDLVGTVIADRYRITELLGEGGMGKVYKAQHVRLPSLAAIKVLRKELMADAAAVARFNREASNASRVEHEAITRVFDFGETRDGQVYLAMEYVPGPTLSHLVEQEGPLPLARTATIVRQVADGLDAAHQKHLVHRDLKAENIMVVTDEDGVDRCKIVDFGIAKAVGSEAGETSLTRTGFVVGTPEFMSPEQLMGESVDHRSDVYSLALVTYQCLTRELPFDNTTIDRGLNARLFADPRPLADVYPSVAWPPRLQGVFDQGLQRNPTMRYQSAGAFAKAFDAAIAGYQAAAPRSNQATVMFPVHSREIPVVQSVIPTPVSAPIIPSEPTPTSPKAVSPPVVSPPVVSPPVAPSVGTTPAPATVLRSAVPTPSSPLAPVPPVPPVLASANAAASGASLRATEAAEHRQRRARFLITLGGTVLVVVAAGVWLVNRPRPTGTVAAPEASLPTPSNVPTATSTSALTTPPTSAAALPAAPPGAVPGHGSQPSAPGGARPGSVTGAPMAAGAAAGAAGGVPSSAAPGAGLASSTRAPVSAGLFYRSAETDTIDAILDPMRPDLSDADGRRAIPLLRALLGKLPTAADSARAYLHLFEAYGLLSEPVPACAALVRAKELAQTLKQAEQVNRYNAGASIGKRCW